MKFSTINTERLTIRSLKLEDASRISQYRSLSEVARFQSWEHYSLEKAQELINQVNASSPEIKGEWFQFGIEHTKDHILIGDIGFLNTDSDGKSWIGFTLDSAYWNRGFAKEAVSAIVSFYAKNNVTNLWASTDPANTSSQKLLLKMGFLLREELPDDAIFQLP